jgi:flagellar protein FliJ
MDKILPFLIERASGERDRQARVARDTASAAAQAADTLTRLQDFRIECLGRSPAMAGHGATAQSLNDFQNFLTRLDEAIAMQRMEAAQREQRRAAAQQQLIERQQRVLAFETLKTRRSTAREAIAARKAQRDSDEFAARAARAQTQEAR